MEELQTGLSMNIPERIKLYFDYINIVLDVMAIKKIGQQGKINALAVKLQNVGLKMMVVASDDVIEKFIKWRVLAMAGDLSGAEKIIESFADVIFAMRKEIMEETARKPSDVMDILF
jgi:hypothetical protein